MWLTPSPVSADIICAWPHRRPSSQWPMRADTAPHARDIFRSLRYVTGARGLNVWVVCRPSFPRSFKERSVAQGHTVGLPCMVGPSDILSCFGGVCGMEEMEWVSFGAWATKRGEAGNIQSESNRCHFCDAVTQNLYQTTSRLAELAIRRWERRRGQFFCLRFYLPQRAARRGQDSLNVSPRHEAAILPGPLHTVWYQGNESSGGNKETVKINLDDE